MHPRPTRSFYVLLMTMALTLCIISPVPLHAQTETPDPAQFMFNTASTADERPASEIFADVSPAVAFIETPAATGSGALIDHGYILTNAHVIWPYATARVVFADGSEYLDAPVLAWDLVADLALVGPIETDIAPIPLVDGGDLDIGSVVYLIGYPAEVEKFPQPTITSGILSRIRTWDTLDYSFYQVDATTTGGQSGGIMMAQNGDVIGISTFYYSGFGLAGSVADALPRLNAMLGNDTDVTIVDRNFRNDEGVREHKGVLKTDIAEDVYIVQAEVGDRVEITVEGGGQPQLIASSFFLEEIEYTEGGDPEGEQASLNFTVEADVPYYVAVYQQVVEQHGYTLTSSHPLIAYPDPDDGQALKTGKTYIGTMDTPFDTDHYTIFLMANDTIEITVDSLGIDPAIIFVHESDATEDIIADDDSGGGIFGGSAQITYRAPEMGIYEMLVFPSAQSGVGSYFIDVTEASQDAELTPFESSRTFLQSEYGPMAWYESEGNGFSMLYPATWMQMDLEECGEGITFCASDGIGVFYLIEERLGHLPKKSRTSQGYAEFARDSIMQNSGIEVQDIKSVTTLQDLSANRLDYTIELVQFEGRQFMYVDEDEQIAFNAAILVPTDAVAVAEPLIDYIFTSFRYWGAKEQENSAVYYLDRGDKLEASGDYDGAFEAYSRSIELDPEMAEAYWKRGLLYYYNESTEEAQADFDRVAELDPKNAARFNQLSMIFWSDRKYELALQNINRAIRLQPGRVEHYNMRALINAALHDYDYALADIAMTLKFNKGELSPAAQDTRAFIYIQLKDYESAKQDYDVLLTQDFRPPHALLGGGIVYAQLGDAETALALIEEGFALIQDEKYATVTDPQLFVLVSMANRTLSKIE